ncbi:MAG TPA: flagellar hook-basal body complex protein FliE [Gammaproteobacteria bacterium]|nr:flagellar hook-basal body complex protein FliE [Gammaproteobacteria bacterium]
MTQVSPVDIQKVLSQMQRLQAEAAGNLGESDKSSQKNFGDVLSDAIDRVNEVQTEAKELGAAFSQGDPNVTLPQVTLALQKSNIAFNSLMQVRNRLVQSYQEIMNMQI